MKTGQTVTCPPDRGDKAFRARVVHIGENVQTNIHGVRYVWVSVRRLNGREGGGVWPSHRLGFNLENAK